jgi:hypothetical protein
MAGMLTEGKQKLDENRTFEHSRSESPMHVEQEV